MSATIKNGEKKKKSGAQSARLKTKKLLEFAGNAHNQKSLFDCFKNSENDRTLVNDKTTVNDENLENDNNNSMNDDSEACGQCSSMRTMSEKDDNHDLDTMTTESSVRCTTSTTTSNDAKETSLDDFDRTPFTIPNNNHASIASFLKLHPIQPSCTVSHLFTRDFDGSKIPRNWLSFDIAHNKFYCSICMAFSPTSNLFQTGACIDTKHRASRIKEHEMLDCHLVSANAFVRFDRTKSIDQLVNNELNQLRLANVRKNREVVKRITNWIMCIGRQGIAYRGSAESTKYLNDNTVNHGNLLEILKTASQQDEFLKNHLDKCSMSDESATDKKGPIGRGSKVTFLSKTTFNTIIHEIGEKMKQLVVNEIKMVGMFALVVDSTQDIVGHEQCSIVVRYVNRVTHRVEEKLIGILRLKDTSGEGYLDDILDYLRNLKIDNYKLIGGSFDGALNMRSDEKGLQGRLKKINSDFFYIWCYAHNLNLTVCTSVSSVSSAKNLFGLLQTTHTFCSESYKRVLEWEKCTANLKGRKKLIRFEHLGKTRWYSKDKALSKIFGSFSEPSTDIFLSLLTFLHNIKASKSFDSKTSFEAGALLDNWIKMDTILTAFVFLKIFQILGPLSKYLQNKGLDVMAALSMSETAISRTAKIRDSFEDVKFKAVNFAKAINDIIEDNIEDPNAIQVIVEEEIPDRRIRRVKRMPGERAQDEPIENVWQNYKVQQFLVICDTTTQSLKNRFSNKENEYLMKEMAFFQPRLFEDVVKIEPLHLSFISRVLNINESKLVKELRDFAHNFVSLRKLDDVTCLTQNLELNDSDLEFWNSDSDEDDEDDDSKLKKCVSSKESCNNCLKCCFQLLCKFNLHTSAYSNLYLAYEYILTLPCTQVTCERSFSHLKIIKSRLRAALKQNLLEALMLMNVERNLTFNVDVDEIVNSIGHSSAELKRYLIE